MPPLTELQKKIEAYIKLTAQIKQLEAEQILLQRDICDMSPFKVGQKVEISEDEYYGSDMTKQVLFISKVIFVGKFKYRFNRVKKDGTMSSQSAGFYLPKNIKSI